MMKFLKSILVILLVSFGLGAAYPDRASAQGPPEAKKRAWLALEQALAQKVRTFRGTVGVVVKDLGTGWEISFNRDTLIPSASLVKIPVMLSCFYAAQDGVMSLGSSVRLKGSDKVSGSPVLGDKPAGSMFTVEELFAPMIAYSDNTAANVVIDALGFEALNRYFKKMGLKDTNITRKMMDFKERRDGVENYTTAADMAYLLEMLYRNKFLNTAVSERCLDILGQQKINDRIPKKLPKDGTCDIAHKTGLERHVCHDVGIVYTQKGDFLVCVLVKHRDRLARSSKRLIADIACRTYDYYQNLD
jgi:beta-lactamase class A